MRLRNIKNAVELLEKNKLNYIKNPIDYKGDRSKLFNNDNPIHLEIGMGKGQFLTTLAKLNPNINYIGVDMYPSILLRASQKLELEQLSNIKLFYYDASKFDEVFEKEISRIYLNFSDPWPKNAHEKRRLTSNTFLPIYNNILKKDCEIHFKTDNIKLFEFSLENLANNQLILSNISLDLHKSDIVGNVMTEYEEKFSPKGPIYRLEAKFRK